MTSDDLETRARKVLDTIIYMTLGSTETDGRPRVSPVWFTHADYADLYWVSRPDSTHSVNVHERPDVNIVVFDSTVPVGQGRAVYVTGQASQVPEGDLTEHCARAFRADRGGVRPFTPADLSGEADLRLYVAHADVHEVHVSGDDPVHGNGRDRRVRVSLGPITPPAPA
jgi:hypothetical protein